MPVRNYCRWYNPDEFPPNEHTHYSERISWLHLTDELPRYQAAMD